MRLPSPILRFALGVAPVLSILSIAGLVAAPQRAAAGAQPPANEDEIRRLEQLEVRAVMTRDRDTLRTLWDAAYIVNNPEGVIAEAGADATDRPVMKLPRQSMTRTTEKVTFRGDFAIAMGGETIVPGEGQPKAGQTVARRYTNFWMKQPGGWKLVARHANVVCP